jgi:hypothetical protein
MRCILARPFVCGGSFGLVQQDAWTPAEQALTERLIAERYQPLASIDGRARQIGTQSADSPGPGRVALARRSHGRTFCQRCMSQELASSHDPRVQRGPHT